MKTTYETGDVFENTLTKDKVIVLANLPVAVKIPDESPMLHPDDHIDVTNEKWVFVENRVKD